MSTKKFGIVTGIALMLSVVVSPAFAACSLSTLSECDNNGLMALVLQLLSGQTQQQTTGTITGIPAGFTFTTNLKQGSTGNDVKYLQVLLNSDTATSVGNKGSETSYFGSMTKAAVVKFQNKYASEVLTPYGLTAGTGFFGSSSRAKANALIASGTGTGTTLPAGCTSTTGYSTTTGQPCGTGTVVTGTPNTVALAANNPIAASIISDTTVGGQSLVPMLTINVTAGSSDVNVTTLKVRKGGISTDSDINNAYLYYGNTKLAEMQSVTSGVITFTGTLFTVPAGQTKQITVKMDIAKNISAGKTYSFSINSASDITSSVVLSGNFPIVGNTMTVASVSDLGQLTVAHVTDPGTAADPQSNLELWRFSLAAAAQNLKVTSITLTNIGSADSSAIQNLKLFDGGTQVGPTVVSMASDRTVTFDLTSAPLLINSGITKNISVRGDVIGGASRTFKFFIQRASDVVVTDVNYNVSIVPNGTATWSVIQAGQTTTVNTGAFSVTRTNDSANGYVALHGTNVVLAKYNFKATGEDEKINSLTIEADIATTGTANHTGSIKNVKILVDGVQVGSTISTLVNASDTAYVTQFPVNLGNSFIAKAGQTYVVTIVGDITGTAVDTAQIIVRFPTCNTNVGNCNNAQGQNSYTAINVPSSNQPSNTLVVSTGALTGSANISIGTISVVSGVTNKRIASFSLTAGAAEGVNLNSVTVVDTGSHQGFGSAFANMKLMYNGTQVGTTIASPSAAKATTQTFNISPALAIAAGQSIQLDVYADVLSGASWTPNDKVNITKATSGTGSTTNSTVSLADAKDGQPIEIVGSGTLAVSVDGSSPQTQQIVMGSTDVILGSWKFEANSNEDLDINQIIVEDVSSDHIGGDINNLKLFVGGQQVGNTIPGLDAASTGKATFGSSSSVLFTVPASTFKVLTVKASVTSPLYASGANKAVQLKLTLPQTGTITGAISDKIIARGAQSGGYASTAVASATTYTVNPAYAYRTKLAAALNSASPSGTGHARQSNDTIFKMDLVANAGYQAAFRQAAVMSDLSTTTPAFGGAQTITTTVAAVDADAGGTGTATLSTDASAIAQSPAAQKVTLGDAPTVAGDGMSITFAATDLSAYNGLGIWVKSTNAKVYDINFTGTAFAGQSVTGTAAWQFVMVPFGTTARDEVTAITLLSHAKGDAADYVEVGPMYLYKDYIKANINGSGLTTTPTLITLKDDTGATVATAYNVGSATAGTVYFIPTTGEYDIAAGATKTLSMITDTAALIAASNNLSVQVGLGSNSSTVSSNPGGIVFFPGRTGDPSVAWSDSIPNPVQGGSIGY